jgi:hypothetical protein
VHHEASQAVSAEQRLKGLDVTLPTPPEPFGAYVEAVQTGNLRDRRLSRVPDRARLRKLSGDGRRA